MFALSERRVINYPTVFQEVRYIFFHVTVSGLAWMLCVSRGDPLLLKNCNCRGGECGMRASSSHLPLQPLNPEKRPLNNNTALLLLCNSFAHKAKAGKSLMVSLPLTFPFSEGQEYL